MIRIANHILSKGLIIIKSFSATTLPISDDFGYVSDPTLLFDDYGSVTDPSISFSEDDGSVVPDPGTTPAEQAFFDQAPDYYDFNMKDFTIQVRNRDTVQWSVVLTSSSNTKNGDLPTTFGTGDSTAVDVFFGISSQDHSLAHGAQIANFSVSAYDPINNETFNWTVVCTALYIG